jgi:glycosyltransferase involved in cell wall biosynthesis
MSDEIRDRNVPLLYYHVWDCEPTPHYNRPYYESCDYIGCISKLTHNIIKDVGLGHIAEYIPHAVDTNIFKPLSQEEVMKEKIRILGENRKDSFVVFYNSRNARRKMTSDVVRLFKQFADMVGDKEGEKCFLLMHTDPHDPEGANLFAVCELLGLKPSQITFSREKVQPELMNKLYNISDITIALSNNEGWGLSLTESLAAGVPIVCNYTGGMRDQVRDEDGNAYGIGIIPATRSMTGSQQIPYIFDDRNADEDVIAALVEMYNMSKQDYEDLSKKCRERAVRDFHVDRMVNQWDVALEKTIKEFKEKGFRGRIKFSEV